MAEIERLDVEYDRLSLEIDLAGADALSPGGAGGEPPKGWFSSEIFISSREECGVRT
jgi:hypothetical protein